MIFSLPFVEYGGGDILLTSPFAPHDAVAPVALLSRNWIYGGEALWGQHNRAVCGIRLRLFVSAVVLAPAPCGPRHCGIFDVPLVTLVCTTNVDPLLKFASDPPASPKTLNSAPVQFWSRFRTLLCASE